MSLASQAVRSSNVTLNAAQWQLRTSASVKCRILEISIILGAATATSVGWGRPAALAGTPGTSSLFQRDDSADPACVTNIDLTWATTPTAPAVYHRRWNSAATIGVGIVWTFPRGVVIPISGAFVAFNITAGAIGDHNISIDE